MSPHQPAPSARIRPSGRSLAQRSALPLVAVAGVLWGGSGAVGRMLGGSGFGPVQIAAARILVGGLALIVVALVLSRSFPRGRRAWRHVAIVGLCSLTYQVCFFGAVAAGSLSLATLVTIGSAPVFVAGFQVVRSGRVEVFTVGVLALALTGLGLLVGQPDAGSSAWLVTLLALGAGASFAALTLVADGPVTHIDPIAATGCSLGGAGAALALVVMVTPALGTAQGPQWTPGVLAWIVVLGVVCTAAPYACYLTGLLRTPAHLATVLALLEPLTGTLIAVSLFGERLSALGWLGAALLFVAVVAVSIRGTRLVAPEAG